MKVLQINCDCEFGSTGGVVRGIYKEVIERGGECLCLYGRLRDFDDINSFRIASRGNVYFNAFMNRICDNDGFGMKKNHKKLVAILNEFRPDIIQLHNVHGYYMNVELLFDEIRKHDIPVVWTLHDCWALTGHCAYFDYAGCNKWKTGCGGCIQLKEYPKTFFDQTQKNYIKKKKVFTSLQNLHIITPSNWLAGLVSESYLAAYPVSVINNGIDLSKFTPKPQEKHHEEIRILGVANTWDKRKGVNTFYKLSQSVDERYKITMVGFVPEEIKKKLSKNIRIVERTENQKDLIELYQWADVFLNPTLEDNFPTTNLEAMACGTPVITFGNGGSAECLNEECGFVVRQDDIEVIKDYAEKVMQDSGLFSQKCVERAASFDMKTCYEKYMNLYQQLI